MGTLFLYVNKFGLGSVADFSNTGQNFKFSRMHPLLTHVKGDVV